MAEGVRKTRIIKEIQETNVEQNCGLLPTMSYARMAAAAQPDQVCQWFSHKKNNSNRLTYR